MTRAAKDRIVTESDLKCLLDKCRDSIDKCVHVLPEGSLKREAAEILAQTEDVLDSEFQRVTIIVGEILGNKAIDVVIPEWHPNELLILPIKVIPKEFRSSLVPGLKLYAHINIHTEHSKDLVFRDFALVM